MTIDWWTLGIQAVNVVILIWLLGRFFWRPVAAMIEQRRTAAQQLLTEAETKRRQATDGLAEIERTRKGFDREREAIIAAAQVSAEQTRAGILASAAKEAASLGASAKVAIEKERAAAEKVWAERANRLAIEIAERLVARIGGSAANAAFLDWLLGEIRKLPSSVRQTVATNGAMLEAVSAAPIDAVDQEHYRELIGEAFGSHPKINFRADPALIAGLELHGPHLVINNSWRADLAKILVDLEHDA